MTQNRKDVWTELATKEAKGKEPTVTETPERIDIQPFYDADDRPDGIEADIPGVAPFTRGVKATMYTGRPWTIRQYAGFSTAEESNAFYRRNLAAGQRACRWRSIWQHTVVTTVITHVFQAMLARPVWRLTVLRI